MYFGSSKQDISNALALALVVNGAWQACYISNRHQIQRWWQARRF